MNIQSIAALIVVGVCFAAAVVYLVRHKGGCGSCSGCSGCAGNCANCGKRRSRGGRASRQKKKTENK